MKAFGASMDKPDVARDIAFHMTDWDDDLEVLNALYEQPEKYGHDEIRRAVLKLLAHVPNHLAAAKKLGGLGPIEDISSVDALQEDEDD